MKRGRKSKAAAAEPAQKKGTEDVNGRIARLEEELSVARANVTSLSEELSEAQERMARLEEELREAYQEQKRALEEVAQQKRELEKRERDFEASRHRVQETSPGACIDLKVGGRMFSVTLEMMLKHPNSYFGAMFNGRWEEKVGKDGSIFINRNGDVFKHIVNYLRSDGLKAELSQTKLELLLEEADYFGLEGLVEILKPLQPAANMDDWIWNKTTNATLFCGGLAITKTFGGDMYDCHSRGSEGWSAGVHEWNVRLDTGGSGFELGICLDQFSMRVYLGCFQGTAYNGITNQSIPNAIPNFPKGGLPAGSLVSCRLDMDAKTLTFGLNGQWNAAATITNIPANTWYPYVSLYAENSAVTIVRE